MPRGPRIASGIQEERGRSTDVTEPPNAATPEPLKSGHCR